MVKRNVETNFKKGGTQILSGVVQYQGTCRGWRRMMEFDQHEGFQDLNEVSQA